MNHKSFFSNLWKNFSKWVVNHKYWLTAAALLLLLRLLANKVFGIIVIAFFLYILVYPVLEYLRAKTKSRRLAAMSTVILLTAFVLFILSVVIPALVTQIADLMKNYQTIAAQTQSVSAYLQQKLTALLEILPESLQTMFKENISQYLNLWSNSLLEFFKDIYSSLFKIITSVAQFLVAYVLLIYMLFDSKPLEKIKDFLLNETTAKEKKMLVLTYEQLTAYFGGTILMSILSFFAVWIFYAILGLKFSLLLALWDGFMQFIPFFGPILAMIPAILVTLPDNAYQILPILIFFGIQQCILAYIIAPNILSKSTRLSPLVVFLMLMIGMEVAGIWGMIFSLPLTSLIILYVKLRKS